MFHFYRKSRSKKNTLRAFKTFICDSFRLPLLQAREISKV